MKCFVSLMMAVCLVAGLAIAASAQDTGDRYWASSNQTFTQLGFSQASNPTDRSINKTRDYSAVITDGGNTVWSINDNNGPNAYMKMYKDGVVGNGGNVSSSGLVMAKIKYISGSSAGTFGFSNASNNISALICVRSGGINLKTAGGYTDSINGGTWALPVSTSDYRVYAMQWQKSGTVQVKVWVSNGSDWSSNSADWTALNGGNWIGFTGDGALQDDIGGGLFNVAGVLAGSTGSSGEAWNGNMQYVVHNHMYLNPWEYDPAAPIPEPGGMLALASGLIAMAGFAIRRRRA